MNKNSADSKQKKTTTNQAAVAPALEPQEVIAEADQAEEEDSIMEGDRDEVTDLSVPDPISNLVRDLNGKLTPRPDSIVFETRRERSTGKLSTKSDVFGGKRHMNKKSQDSHFKEHDDDDFNGKLSTRSEATIVKRGKSDAKLQNMIDTLLEDSQYEIQIEVKQTSIKKKPEKVLDRKSKEHKVPEDIDRNHLALEIVREIRERLWKSPAKEWQDNLINIEDTSSTEEPKKRRIARLTTEDMTNERQREQSEDEAEEPVRVAVPEGYSKDDEEEEEEEGENQIKGPLLEEEFSGEEDLSNANSTNKVQMQEQSENDKQDENVEFISDLGESEEETNIRLGRKEADEENLFEEEEDVSEDESIIEQKESHRDQEEHQTKRANDTKASDIVEINDESDRMDEEEGKQQEESIAEQNNKKLEEMDEEAADPFESPQSNDDADLGEVIDESVKMDEEKGLGEQELEDDDNADKKLGNQEEFAGEVNSQQEKLKNRGQDRVDGTSQSDIEDEEEDLYTKEKAQDFTATQEEYEDTQTNYRLRKKKNKDREPNNKSDKGNESEKSELYKEQGDERVTQLVDDIIHENEKEVISDDEQDSVQAFERIADLEIKDVEQIKITTRITVAAGDGDEEYNPTNGRVDSYLESQELFGIVRPNLFKESHSLSKEPIKKDDEGDKVDNASVKSEVYENISKLADIEDIRMAGQTQIEKEIEQELNKELEEFGENINESEIIPNSVDEENDKSRDGFGEKRDFSEPQTHEESYHKIEEVSQRQRNLQESQSMSDLRRANQNTAEKRVEPKELEESQESNENLFDLRNRESVQKTSKEEEANAKKAQIEANKENPKNNHHKAEEVATNKSSDKSAPAPSEKRAQSKVYKIEEDDEDIYVNYRGTRSRDQHPERPRHFIREMIKSVGDKDDEDDYVEEEEDYEEGENEEEDPQQENQGDEKEADQVNQGDNDEEDDEDERDKILEEVEEAEEEKEDDEEEEEAAEEEKEIEDIEEVEQRSLRREEEEPEEDFTHNRPSERREYSVYDDHRILEAYDAYVERNGEEGSKSVKTWETITDPLTRKRLLKNTRSGESMRNRYRKTLDLLTEAHKDQIREWIRTHSEEEARNHYLKFEKAGVFKRKTFAGIAYKNFTLDHPSKRKQAANDIRREAPVAKPGTNVNLKNIRRGRNAGQVEKSFYKGNEDEFDDIEPVPEETGSALDARMQRLLETYERPRQNRVRDESEEVKEIPKPKAVLVSDWKTHLASRRPQVERSYRHDTLEESNSSNRNVNLRTPGPKKGTNDFKFTTNLNNSNVARTNDRVRGYQRNAINPINMNLNNVENKKETKKRKGAGPERDIYEIHHNGIKKVKSIDYYEQNSLIICDAFKQKKTVDLNISENDKEELSVYVDVSGNFRQFVWDEEEEFEESQRMSQNYILEKLNAYSKRYKIPVDKINQIFMRVSLHFDDLEAFLRTRDDSILWDPDEDKDILEGDSTALRYLKSLKGADRVIRRREYLIRQ